VRAGGRREAPGVVGDRSTLGTSRLGGWDRVADRQTDSAEALQPALVQDNEGPLASPVEPTLPSILGQAHKRRGRTMETLRGKCVEVQSDKVASI
jgi:hypothetical protein